MEQGQRLRGWPINPPFLLAAGCMVLILVGAGLLKLPFSLNGALSWGDVLFTSVSAVTVTGLVVTDTGAAFSFWGQLIILFLIQAGGLGLMTFAVLALLALGGRVRGRRRSFSAGPGVGAGAWLVAGVMVVPVSQCFGL